MPTTMEILITAVDQASKTFDQVGSRAEKAFQQADQAAKKIDLKKLTGDLDAFGSKAMGAGGSLTIGLTAPIVATGAAITKFGMDFDSAMRNVNSISQLSEENFKKLKLEVRGLFGDKPIQDAAALANGLYDIASSGFEGAAGLTVLKASAIAATAGVSDTATASKAITGVLNAYGKAASEAGDVSDILFQTVNKGVVTFGELAGGIGPVIATASAAGISFEEVGAAIATLTKGGIPAAEAMTSLSGIITQFLSPADALKIALKDAGHESGLALLQTEGLEGAIKFLNEATGGSAAKMAELVPEIRGMRGALSLGRQEGKAFAEDLESIGNASNRAGAAGKAFAEQSKSDAVQAQIAANKFKDSMIALYESTASVRATVLKVLNMVAGAVSKLADGFSKLPEPVKFVVVGIIALLAVVGPLLMMLGGMAHGISAIIQVLPLLSNVTKIATAVQWLWNAAMVANPIGLIVLAIVAAIAAIITIIKVGRDLFVNWDKLSTGGKALRMAILMLLGPIGMIVAGAILIIKNWGPIKEFFKTMWEGVKFVFSAAWEWIKDMFLNYTPTGLVIQHWEVIVKWFENLWQGVKDLTKVAWEGMKNLFLDYTAAGLVIKHWDGISAWFGEAWDKTSAVTVSGWDKIKKNVGKAWEWIHEHSTGMLDKLVGGIKNAFNAIPAFFKGLFDKIAGFFKGIANAAISGINFLIRGLNKISFTAPDWVPNIGGKAIGVNIPQIPLLHSGGEFRSPIGEGLALLRDREIVLTPDDPLAAVYRQRRAPAGGLAFAGGGGNIIFAQGAFDGMIVSSEQELRRFADKIGSLIAERVQRGRGKRL